MGITKMLLLPSFLALAAASDSKCTSKGGTCQDYTQHKCTAGYEQYLCDGNSARRCCLGCDQSCEEKELEDSTHDSKCDAKAGECLHDTNYCGGVYHSGLCGGGSHRKCCVIQNFKKGDHYWNHYSKVALSRYALPAGYEFASLEEAQQKCIEVGDLCAGVTKENSYTYTIRATYKFVSSSTEESWTKEIVFSDNFVPRPQWGAREPTAVTSFSLPASHGLIGHHTAGHECFTLDECISRMKGTQNYHMDSRGWNDIGYNFLIGEDGRIYEGRGFYRQGAHVSNWNSVTLGFSIMGDFSYKMPNQAALDAVDTLINYMEEKNFLNKNCYEFAGHRDHGNTVCPGDPLYSHWSSYNHWHEVC